ncbi:hypothetical protein FRC12_009988, partial [Ceratobasidium sp. 428]
MHNLAKGPMIRSKLCLNPIPVSLMFLSVNTSLSSSRSIQQTRFNDLRLADVSRNLGES